MRLGSPYRTKYRDNSVLRGTTPGMTGDEVEEVDDHPDHPTGGQVSPAESKEAAARLAAAA